jgi:hypothetical protein
MEAANVVADSPDATTATTSANPPDAAAVRVALCHAELAAIRTDLAERTETLRQSHEICRTERDTVAEYRRVHRAHKQIHAKQQQLQQWLQKHRLARQNLVCSFNVALMRAAMSLRATRLLRRDLDEAKRKLHDVPILEACPKCNARFLSLSSLEEHLTMSHGVVPSSESWTDMVRWRRNRMVHQKSHPEWDPTTCRCFESSVQTLSALEKEEKQRDSSSSSSSSSTASSSSSSAARAPPRTHPVSLR